MINMFSNSMYLASAACLNANLLQHSGNFGVAIANKFLGNEVGYKKSLGFAATYISQNRNELMMLAALVTLTTTFGVTDNSLAQTFGSYAVYLKPALSMQKGLFYFSMAAQISQGMPWFYQQMAKA